MSKTEISTTPDLATRGISSTNFARAFVLLALISGITIGMNKIQVTLLALQLNAEPWQIGVLIGAESLSMMLMSLPAGVLISRFSARRVYAVASIGAMLLYPLIAYAANWVIAAMFLCIAGICIPFRVVSMNTSWFERLPEIGISKGGWYRGTLTLGIGLLGPLLGSMTSQHFGIQGSYLFTSALFGLMSVYGFVILSRKHTIAADTKSRQGFTDMLKYLGDPTVRQACVYDGLGGLVRGFFGTFIIVMVVRQFHWGVQSGVTLMVVEGATYVIALLTLGSIVPRLGDNLTYNIGHATLVAGLLVLGTSTSMVAFMIGAILQALGQALNHLVNVSRLAHSGHNMGHVSGLFTMIGMGGGFFGATLGGLLSKGFVLQDIFLIWIPVWLSICPGFRQFIRSFVPVSANR